jgi:diadenosine tetraphosphate (Ap4A) HIT family hydrolase
LINQSINQSPDKLISRHPAAIMTSPFFDASCPFCAIVKTYPHPANNITAPDSDSTAHIVLSTPQVLAFLDRLPLTKCHTIIIPREHYELLTDIPPEYAAEVGRALPVVSRAVIEVSGADGFNVVQNNGIVSWRGAGVDW